MHKKCIYSYTYTHTHGNMSWCVFISISRESMNGSATSFFASQISYVFNKMMPSNDVITFVYQYDVYFWLSKQFLNIAFWISFVCLENLYRCIIWILCNQHYSFNKKSYDITTPLHKLHCMVRSSSYQIHFEKNSYKRSIHIYYKLSDI